MTVKPRLVMLNLEKKGHAVYGAPGRRLIFAFRFRGKEQLMLCSAHLNCRRFPKGVSDTYGSLLTMYSTAP
jgi:hypothetical protein